MSEQNFIILDDDFIYTQIEEILVEVSAKSLNFREKGTLDGVCDLTNIAKLDTEDFEQLFDYLYQFQSLEKFKATFTPAIYSLPQEDICDRVSIKGKSPISSINYITFFLVCFMENKDALEKVFEKDITEDEFGVKSFKNWDRKFKIFFENKVFTQNLFIFRALSYANFYEENSRFYEGKSDLNKIFHNIRKFYLIITERHLIYKRQKGISKKNVFHTSFEKGISFELECSEILEKNGWQTQLTAKTGDQGADIIAAKGKLKLVIQCKNYESAAGNDSVQQVIAAMSFFDANIAAVISKSGFTKSATQLAEKTGVMMLSLEDLEEI